MTLSTAKGYVDAAITSGGVISFYGHKFAAAAAALTWAIADWQALCDYLAYKQGQGLLEVLSWGELAQKLRSGRMNLSSSRSVV